MPHGECKLTHFILGYSLLRASLGVIIVCIQHMDQLSLQGKCLFSNITRVDKRGFYCGQEPMSYELLIHSHCGGSTLHSLSTLGKIQMYNNIEHTSDYIVCISLQYSGRSGMQVRVASGCATGAVLGLRGTF